VPRPATAQNWGRPADGQGRPHPPPLPRDSCDRRPERSAGPDPWPIAPAEAAQWTESKPHGFGQARADGGGIRDGAQREAGSCCQIAHNGWPQARSRRFGQDRRCDMHQAPSGQPRRACRCRRGQPINTMFLRGHDTLLRWNQPQYCAVRMDYSCILIHYGTCFHQSGTQEGKWTKWTDTDQALIPRFAPPDAALPRFRGVAGPVGRCSRTTVRARIERLQRPGRYSWGSGVVAEGDVAQGPLCGILMMIRRRGRGADPHPATVTGPCRMCAPVSQTNGRWDMIRRDRDRHGWRILDPPLLAIRRFDGVVSPRTNLSEHPPNPGR